MDTRPDRPALRAARIGRGWSQADAARELAELARSRGVAAAAAASLKTQLSRWENGHATPEPVHRGLLGELYGRTSEELGLAGPAPPAAAGGPALLRARLAAAAAVDEGVVALWRSHLAAVRRLDDELGAAGAGELLRAQVEQLEQTLAHTLPARRAPVAAVLADSAVLAGRQALDVGRPELAWSRYGSALAAAREAGVASARADALAGQSAVLVEVGLPDQAIALLAHTGPTQPPYARARLAAARGVASAAVGDAEAAHRAFADAQRATAPVIDVVHRLDGPAIEVADLHRWHGHALTCLRDPAAIQRLQSALAADPPAVRHRAGLHADLALALAGAGRTDEGSLHARTARDLAERIGSRRIPARLAGLEVSSQFDES